MQEKLEGSDVKPIRMKYGATANRSTQVIESLKKMITEVKAGFHWVNQDSHKVKRYDGLWLVSDISYDYDGFDLPEFKGICFSNLKDSVHFDSKI